MATLGPRHPEPSTAAELIEARELAAMVAPDRAELWYLLGDILYHEGQIIGVADRARRCGDAFRRVLALDPDLSDVEFHMLDLAAATGGTLLAGEVAAKILARDSVGELAGYAVWMPALVHDDAERWAHARARMERMSPHELTISMSGAFDARRGIPAELLGDRDAAIRAYRAYLELRVDPEPTVRPLDDGVRARLAALTSREP